MPQSHDNVKSISLSTSLPAVDNTGRFFLVDFIRVFAIFMVVLTHTSAGPMQKFSSISQSAWWTGNLLFSFADQGVPLFLMVSGLLLLSPEKDEPLNIFFRKRMVKVVIPFVFWGAVYYSWRIFYKLESYTVHEAISIFTKGPIYYHLWFIYLILGLYIATPILRVYTREASLSNKLYFFAMWFAFSSMLPFICNIADVQLGISRFLFTGLIGYYFIGHLLVKVDLSYKFFWGIIVVVILATLFTAIGTYILTVRHEGQYHGYFIYLSRPNIIIFSICMFLVLQKIHSAKIFSKSPITIFIRKVSTASFGIYLLHPIILELLGDGWIGFHLSAMTIHPIVGIPMTLIVTILIAFLIVTLFRKIPILKSVVP